jgi:hypothetical protein
MLRQHQAVCGAHSLPGAVNEALFLFAVPEQADVTQT